MNGGREPLENAYTFKLFPQSIFWVLLEIATSATNGYFWLYLTSNHKSILSDTKFTLNTYIWSTQGKYLHA